MQKQAYRMMRLFFCKIVTKKQDAYFFFQGKVVIIYR